MPGLVAYQQHVLSNMGKYIYSAPWWGEMFLSDFGMVDPKWTRLLTNAYLSSKSTKGGSPSAYTLTLKLVEDILMNVFPVITYIYRPFRLIDMQCIIKNKV